jgi:hypothetical protein
MLSAQFARYATPDECVMHATWEEIQFWESRHEDTVSVAPDQNPVQRGTVAAVRACVARFSLSRTPTQDLLGLGRAYLAAELDVQADSAFARLTQSTVRAPNRPWILSQIVDAYLDARPSHQRRAMEYATRLDGIGATAAPERMMAYLGLARQARGRDDTLFEARALEAALAASRALVGEARNAYAAISRTVYVARALLQGRRNNVTAAMATIEEGIQVLTPLQPTYAERLRGYQNFFVLVGKPAPPIQASRWFNADVRTQTSLPTQPSTPLPAGKTSLVVFANMGGEYYPAYAMVRRFAAAFGANLQIVFVTNTTGAYREQLVTPDSESLLLQHYYLVDRQLPVALAIWHTPYTRIKDGRLQPTWLPNQDAYHLPPADGLVAYVIAPNGTVRFVTVLRQENEAELTHVIRSVIPDR